MNKFEKNGYLDIKSYLGTNMPFIFCWGGRGTGKSYGAIKFVIENKIRFFYIRRTQTQLDMIGTNELSPFKKYCADAEIDVEVKRIHKGVVGFFLNDELIGYGAALSTISNIRGFDASDVTMIVYDEFIPEKHERPIKYEGEAFLNMYETINRNRELEGEPPVQVLCIANANDIGNEIFLELGFVDIAQKMQLKKQFYYLNPEKNLLLINAEDSPISQKKRETALYKLTKGSNYEKMALENEFIDDSIAEIRSRNLKEFTPYVAIGSICIYKHKSENCYYVTEHFSGSPPRFTTAKADREKFSKRYYFLWNAYLDRRMEFETKLCSLLFERMW